MSLSERDRSRLEEMCDLLEEIQKDRLAIKNNKESSDRSLVARAIAFDFEQLGEIAGRMSEEFLFAHPNFPLRYMGACALAPAVSVNGKVYPQMTVDGVNKVIDEYKAKEVEA